MKRIRKHTIVLVLAVVASGLLVGAALATMGGGFTATPAVKGTMAGEVHLNSDRIKFQTKGSVDIASNEVTYEAGGYSGWHMHPGVVLVVVKSGSVDRYVGSCTNPTTYSQGQAFVEYGDEPPMQIQSSGGAVLEVTYVVPNGSLLKVDSPAPC